MDFRASCWDIPSLRLRTLKIFELSVESMARSYQAQQSLFVTLNWHIQNKKYLLTSSVSKLSFDLKDKSYYIKFLYTRCFKFVICSFVVSKVDILKRMIRCFKVNLYYCVTFISKDLWHYVPLEIQKVNK